MPDSQREKTTELTALKNIGPLLATALAAAGVRTYADLLSIGPAELYRRMQAKSARRLPVCYYLYSLEGAIRDVRWDSLSADEKRRLRMEAGLA